jgi:hypothetical protein
MEANGQLVAGFVKTIAEITDSCAVTQLMSAALRTGNGNFMDIPDGQVFRQIGRDFEKFFHFNR